MRKRKRSKDRRKRHGKVDPLSVQVSVRTHLPEDIKISSAVLQEAVRRWAETGTAPRGFEIDAVYWQNPARSWENEAHSEDEIEEARITLHLASWLRQKRLGINKVG